MAELEKIIKVLKKCHPQAPHQSFLVLDGTVGQNALTQVEEFLKYAQVNGLIMTKLDGTSHGGVLANIINRYHIPVVAEGYGESIEDFSLFHLHTFIKRWTEGE